MKQYCFAALLGCALFATTNAQTSAPADSLLKAIPTAAVPAAAAPAAAPEPGTATTPAKPSAPRWYDKINFRGYSQFRYNRLMETNPELRCDQCDRSIGRGQGFSFRRARLIFSGDVHERVFVYLQFDYSADASSSNKHFLQVRDAYADYAFDRKKTLRLRFGQSKIPFGFENLQSSSNRLPLDRADATNSGAPNERDFGGFLYYAPASKRALLRHLVEDGLKGSGDYGVLGFGLYNGQGTNKPELNDNLHAIARVSYPFEIGGQILEPGIQGYTGKFTLAKDQISSGVRLNKDATYIDRRAAVSLVLYPQPFGILAEYNIGESPTFDTETDSIATRSLRGGFVTFSYRKEVPKWGVFQPYLRYQVYQGGKKLETDARYHDVNETELGIEWQPIKNLELTLAYANSRRVFQDFKTDYREQGRFLRLQLQVNY
jgi:hypothetical protein